MELFSFTVLQNSLVVYEILLLEGLVKPLLTLSRYGLFMEVHLVAVMVTSYIDFLLFQVNFGHLFSRNYKYYLFKFIGITFLLFAYLYSVYNYIISVLLVLYYFIFP